MVGLMKTTKTAIAKFVKGKLGSNSAWAIKAMVRIYKENQTEAEKAIEETKEDNGIGFSGIDGQILSSFAKQVIEGRSLSPKQMALVFKVMPKYSRQVIAFSDTEKLLAQVNAEVKA